MFSFVAFLFVFVFQNASLENEIQLLRQSEGGNIVFKGVNLPEGMAPSSMNIINSQNEYLIHILQVNILHLIVDVD